MTLKETQTIAMIHSIQLYTHIKNIPFQSFMKWAFGDSWEALLLSSFSEAWNQRHSQLALTKNGKELSAIIYSMVDWYAQINKPE